MNDLLSDSPISLRQKVASYYELTKPKVVMTMVFTAWTGMFLARPGTFPLTAFIFGTLGITFLAGSAAAVNHVVDRYIDAKMYRTKNRPLPSGDISPSNCFVFAFILGLLGLIILIAFVNVLTAILTLLSSVGYAFIYTMYLKPCLLYTSPSPRDATLSRMPSSA